MKTRLTFFAASAPSLSIAVSISSSEVGQTSGQKV